jgi:hypothetical protein
LVNILKSLRRHNRCHLRNLATRYFVNNRRRLNHKPKPQNRLRLNLRYCPRRRRLNHLRRPQLNHLTHHHRRRRLRKSQMNQ